jgi:hypothetical protein
LQGAFRQLTRGHNLVRDKLQLAATVKMNGPSCLGENVEGIK